MKKFLNLIVYGGCAFLLVLMFAFMAGNGIHGDFFGTNVGSKLYTLAFGGEYGDANGGLVVAFILFVIAFLGSALLAVFDVLKKELPFANFITMGLGLFALVSGILFFCTTGLVGGGKLGGGAVFCGLCGLLSGLALIFWGLNKQFKLVNLD